MNMRLRLSLSALVIGCAVNAFADDDERQIYQANPPESHDRAVQRAVQANEQRTADRTGTGESTDSPTVSGRDAISIPLDDTGIADWSYVNPRSPVTVQAGKGVDFENLTADRTFEVSTTVAVRPGDVEITSRIPMTVPLFVYDALMPGDIPRQPPGATREEVLAQTIDMFEQQLLAEASTVHRQYATILESVRKLEVALRNRAILRATEATARGVVGKLSGASTIEEVDKAKKEMKEAIDARVEADKKILTMSTDLEGKRKNLIDKLAAEAARLRKQRSTITDTVQREHLTRQIALQEIAVDALKNQSDDTALLAPFRLELRGALLEDCTVNAGVATCAATIRVYPNGVSGFPHSVLEKQPDGAALAKFTVRFFEEEETPTKVTAYLVSSNQQNRIAAPKTAASILAVASVGAALDPFVEDRSATSRNCAFLCPDKPYSGARRTHYTGTGRVEVTQTFGNLLDGKVNLAYKEGDLGGPATTTNVKLSQYRFNLYSLRGITFHFGKFPFAAPSSGIAINETGEGFRLAFRNLAASHISKRESATNTADAANRDDEVWLVEAVNMPLWSPIRKALKKRNPIRTISLTALYGNDRKLPETKDHPVTKLKEEVFSQHSYLTVGGQIGFTMPGHLYGSIAGYRSRRNADEDGAKCNETRHVCDGSGQVSLLTITRPFSVDEDGKAKRTVTFSLGSGSGDDPDTETKNEGYIGETAGYAPDQIFLSSLAAGVSTRPFIDASALTTDDLKREFMEKDLGAIGIGRGLSNKRYLGIKYVDNNFSLLELIALHIVRIPKTDIRSRVTIVTLNDYRLRHPLFDSRDAGREVDVEFQVETPRSVKVGLKAGYYWPGDALKTIIKDNVWSASGTISISL